MAITSSCAEGGKAPRPTRPRCILKATEAVRQIPTAPPAYRLAVTVQRLGYLQRRWAVWRRSPEEHLAPKGQGLGRRMGADKGLQTGLFVVRQIARKSMRNRHGPAPYRQGEMTQPAVTVPFILYVYQAELYWHRIYEMNI
jgi:hypothetical protein